jgi:isocitrate dehydrogenase
VREGSLPPTARAACAHSAACYKKFRDWGYALATREYRDRVVTERESWVLGNREAKPAITTEENAREIDPGYDLMTPDQQANLNGDYLSDALAAQVGGIGIAPGGNIGEMMFRHLGWEEAADAIIRGMEGAIAAKTVTYDFHRLMEGAKLVRCSEFGRAIVTHM